MDTLPFDIDDTMDDFNPDPHTHMVVPLTISASAMNIHDGMFEHSISSAPVTTASTPTASGTSPVTSHPSNSRRPQRKSTLTQQQKNQKRQRATQDQLLTLEIEFNKNPTPSGPVRERIADEINMTERSVQIWFQNRRAKIKNIAKRSIENGEDCSDIPESMKRYLAIQGFDSNSSMGDMGGHGGGLGSGWLNTETNSSKIVIQHLACRSLTIGTWRRICQNSTDLVIFYCPDKRTLTYYISSEPAGYKIEYPFSSIQSISLSTSDASQAEGAAQEHDGLVVVLNRPPQFYMDSTGNGGFFECNDFTEDHQASKVLTHCLGGHPKGLSSQLAKMVSLESFLKRHETIEPLIMTVSAPVSPVEGRPSSQPGHVGGLINESPFGPGLQPPRGHKRQRSRSVPINPDFIRNQMPSFLMQPHFRSMIQAQSPQLFPPHPAQPLAMQVPSSDINFAANPSGFPGFSGMPGGQYFNNSIRGSQHLPDGAVPLPTTMNSVRMDYGFQQAPTGFIPSPSSDGTHPFIQSSTSDDVHAVAARFGNGFGISTGPPSGIPQFDISIPQSITSPNVPSLANTGSPADLPMALSQHNGLPLNMRPLATSHTRISQSPMSGSLQHTPFTPFSSAPMSSNPIIATQSPPMMVESSSDIFQIPDGNCLPHHNDHSASLMDSKSADGAMTPFPAFDSSMEIDFGHHHQSGMNDGGIHSFDMGFDSMGMGLGVSSALPNSVFWSTGMDTTSDMPPPPTIQETSI